MQLIEEIKSGNFTNINKLFATEPIFYNYCSDIISDIIQGCEINRDTKILYLMFLEVSKVINMPVEKIDYYSLTHAYSVFSTKRNVTWDKEYLKKWFNYFIKEERYKPLMKQLFDTAYNICKENNDYYAIEIIEYMCTNPNVEYREYALFHMDNVERFLDDENDTIASMAQEIVAVKNAYSALPLDGQLLVDLLETALKTNIIKNFHESGMKECRIYGDLFKGHHDFTFPEYYFKMSNYQMIAYRIYSAIVNKELEFAEEMTPIFYSNLLSNNARTL